LTQDNKKNKTKMLTLLALLLFLGVMAVGVVIVTSDEEAKEPDKQEDEADKVEDNGEENGENEDDKTKEKEQARKEREEQLREELGPFFVSLPPLEQEESDRVKARGLYLTGNTAGRESRIEYFKDLIDSTELNSLVIDVKDDHGWVTYPSEIEFVEEIGADRRAPISDLADLVEELHANDIYTIARVVVFKDSYLPEKYPDWAIQRQDGEGIWRDRSDVAWVNPYKKEVWDYNLAVAKEAALMGFQEIQFDYVRFPANAQQISEEVYYPGHDDVGKDKIIAEFLEYARESLEEYNVHISADTFGVIATSWGDSDQIGQTWEKIAPLVDYHSPMIYPSHYGYGYFGYDVPDAHPEGTVTRALEDALKRNAPIETPGIIRPWLQAFTAPWVRGSISYGPDEIREQIEAAYRLGIDEYLLWNANNIYPEEAFITEEETEKLINSIEQTKQEKGKDVLGHTIEEATKNYLEAVKSRNWRDAHIYQSTGFSKDHHEFKEWCDEWVSRLKEYELVSFDYGEKQGEVKVKLTLQHKEEIIELGTQKWDVLKENMVWRINPSSEFIRKLVGDFSTEQESDDDDRQFYPHPNTER